MKFVREYSGEILALTDLLLAFFVGYLVCVATDNAWLGVFAVVVVALYNAMSAAWAYAEGKKRGREEGP